MSDRLYFSCRLRGFTEANMLRHFENVLRLFPFSILAKRGPVLRVYAIEQAEPPLVEREFPPGTDAAGIAAAAEEFAKGDCSVETDASWDLWQYSADWKLEPAPVTVICSGPEFDGAREEHIRIDLGLEARFLPMPEVDGSLHMTQSNLRSLLHLVSEIEHALPIERRQLWSESGVNFAELLTESLSQFEVN